MPEPKLSPQQLYRWLVVPVVLWIIVFGWKPLPFWYLMIPSMLILLVSAIAINPQGFFAEGLTGRDVLWGVGSAVVLYLVFVVGNAVAPLIIPGAHADVGNVYGLKTGFSPWFVGIVLVLVFGPAESLWWQGTVQRVWMRQYGKNAGWLVTAGFYAAIHSASGNPMLVLAALVAGLGWGLLYRLYPRIWPVAISHSLWDLAVLVLLPIH